MMSRGDGILCKPVYRQPGMGLVVGVGMYFSKYFAMMGVRVTRQKSLRAFAVECFDSGTIVVV